MGVIDIASVILKLAFVHAIYGIQVVADSLTIISRDEKSSLGLSLPYCCRCHPSYLETIATSDTSKIM